MVVSSTPGSLLVIYSSGPYNFALTRIMASDHLTLPPVPDGAGSVEERIEACIAGLFGDLLLQKDRVTSLPERAIVVYSCQKIQHRDYIPLPLNVPGFRSIGPPKPVQMFPNKEWCLVALNVVEELYNHKDVTPASKDVTPASDEMKFRIPCPGENWYLEKRTIIAITHAFREAHPAVSIPPAIDSRRAVTLPPPQQVEAPAELPSPGEDFYVSPRIAKELYG
jgi:hypothetical protein